MNMSFTSVCYRKLTRAKGVAIICGLILGTVVLMWLAKDEVHAVYSSGPCPNTVWSRLSSHKYIHISSATFRNISYESVSRMQPVNLTDVECSKVINGDLDEVLYAARFNHCTRQTANDTFYLQIVQDCEDFKMYFGYGQLPTTQTEQEFPIAFSILTYESIEQTERLLRAIYRSHNVYCLHIDAKASNAMFKVFHRISQCLPNVFLPLTRIHVKWAEFTVLAAELICMETVWSSLVKWKYYINLTGREFPIRTNAELVDILRAYNGSNDIDGSMYNRNIDWMKYKWRNEQWRTNTEKEPVPHNFNIHKGSAHIVASRGFVDYALHSPKAIDLKNWMRDTRLPDEHFFNTLNHNAHFGVPGSYKGDPHLKEFYGRYKVWWNNENSTCSGQWSRYVCNIGVIELRNVTRAHHLFVNKLHLDISSLAFDCLEKWYYRKVHSTDNEDFDVQFYRKLKFVKYHV